MFTAFLASVPKEHLQSPTFYRIWPYADSQSNLRPRPLRLPRFRNCRGLSRPSPAFLSRYSCRRRVVFPEPTTWRSSGLTVAYRLRRNRKQNGFCRPSRFRCGRDLPDQYHLGGDCAKTRKVTISPPGGYTKSEPRAVATGSFPRCSSTPVITKTGVGSPFYSL
jgi:hypothetical protein